MLNQIPNDKRNSHSILSVIDALKEGNDFMKKRFYVIAIFLFVMNSCNESLQGFNFNSFNGSPVEELAQAVKNEDLKKIDNLVKLKKTPIDYLDPSFGHSLLMLAVANNLTKSVDRLLELGANPNLRSRISNDEDSSYINTPMFIACDDILNKNNCDDNSLASLIKYGGNVNDKIQIKYVGANYKSYDTPLLKACGGRCLEIVKLLVKSGADINNYDYKEGTGPITTSIIQDRMEILKYLVIEEKAVIPKYCFVVHAHNEAPRKTYTVTEFLLKRNYKKGSQEYNIRMEVLKYLKSNNLK